MQRKIITPCLVAFVATIVLASSVVFGQGVPSGTSDTASGLETVQSLIDASIKARSELRIKIRSASPDELPELEQELALLNIEIKKQQTTFEQIAIGTVDVAILGEIDTSFDWREEVSQIMQPIVANLKALTDKPRKISQLQTLIEKNQEQTSVINTALESIAKNKVITKDTTTQKTLINLENTWLSRKTENQQKLDLAQSQLAELQNPDTSWSKTVGEALGNFFRGRGLTLVLATLAAFLVWLLMRGFLGLSRVKTKGASKRDYRTRTRVAQYGFRVLTFIVIVIAIISVFYIRGDLLLMGLSILAAVGIVLGLRQAIPRFITEAKLLLNLGGIREEERVMYGGLPWQVTSLNMYSVLRNPELTGVMRLPLSQMNELVSRPAGKEPWFPASKGDYILLEGRRLFEVTRLTPETVELNDRGGTITTVPTTDFYSWTFKNLSRGDFFGISSTFGIDYQHQDISLTKVPARFQQAVFDSLHETDLASAIKEVIVEFQSAGDSSLNYWIYVTLDQSAAKAYNKFDRLIQRSLVEVCTKEGWGIPFPHMTIQQHPGNS